MPRSLCRDRLLLEKLSKARGFILQSKIQYLFYYEKNDKILLFSVFIDNIKLKHRELTLLVQDDCNLVAYSEL